MGHVRLSYVIYCHSKRKIRVEDRVLRVMFGSMKQEGAVD
jgi:hypothetical protein